MSNYKSAPIEYYLNPIMSPLLSIKDFSIAAEGKQIVKNVSLEIEKGEVHAIMGPNGSGKSTLVNTLMGHPVYEVTSGSAKFLGKDIFAMSPDERAQAGLFLAFQYPKDIEGVTLRSLLFAAYNAQMQARNPDNKQVSPIKFRQMLLKQAKELSIDPDFVERSLHSGFSGGEKKKAEILQLKILKPLLALLDETDSGLDVDALKIVADGINSMRSPEFSALLVTHYARILDHITPDKVHIMLGGEIIESGGADLAQSIEKEGYEKYEVKE